MTDHHARSTPLAGRSSMATRELLSALAARLSDAGLPPVEFVPAGGVKVADDIRQGDTCDVVVLADKAITSLADEGFVDAGTARRLYSSPSVLAVRADAPATVPSDRDTLVELLRAAASIGYSTGPSGTAFLEVLRHLGLRDELDARLVQASPGNPVGTMVADGRVALGFQQASEMAGIPGVQVLGELPEPFAITSTFSGAVATASTRPDEARRVLDFLGYPGNADVITQHAMTLADTAATHLTEG